MSSLTVRDWQNALSYDQLNQESSWKYLVQLIHESMRIEPPVRSSTPMVLTQDIQVKGETINIQKGIPIVIYFFWLHRNPEEW